MVVAFNCVRRVSRFRCFSKIHCVEFYAFAGLFGDEDHPGPLSHFNWAGRRPAVVGNYPRLPASTQPTSRAREFRSGWGVQSRVPFAGLGKPAGSTWLTNPERAALLISPTGKVYDMQALFSPERVAEKSACTQRMIVGVD